MGKRSARQFKRRPQDLYNTPAKAVAPLLPYLPKDHFTYCEPCCGRGDLIAAMPENAHLDTCYDIRRLKYAGYLDARLLEERHVAASDIIITNPPWTRELLHAMIDRFRRLRPTWLLFDADWAYTQQSSDFMPYCWDMVPVGRLKWFPDSDHVGKDNACWYKFSKRARPTVFHRVLK